MVTPWGEKYRKSDYKYWFPWQLWATEIWGTWTEWNFPEYVLNCRGVCLGMEACIGRAYSFLLNRELQEQVSIKSVENKLCNYILHMIVFPFQMEKQKGWNVKVINLENAFGSIKRTFLSTAGLEAFGLTLQNDIIFSQG